MDGCKVWWLFVLVNGHHLNCDMCNFFYIHGQVWISDQRTQMEWKAAFCYFQEREEVYLYTYNISSHISSIALLRLATDAHSLSEWEERVRFPAATADETLLLFSQLKLHYLILFIIYLKKDNNSLNFF